MAKKAFISNVLSVSAGAFLLLSPLTFPIIRAESSPQEAKKREKPPTDNHEIKEKKPPTTQRKKVLKATSQKVAKKNNKSQNLGKKTESSEITPIKKIEKNLSNYHQKVLSELPRDFGFILSINLKNWRQNREGINLQHLFTPKGISDLFFGGKKIQMPLGFYPYSLFFFKDPIFVLKNLAKKLELTYSQWKKLFTYIDTSRKIFATIHIKPKKSQINRFFQTFLFLPFKKEAAEKLLTYPPTYYWIFPTKNKSNFSFASQLSSYLSENGWKTDKNSPEKIYWLERNKNLLIIDHRNKEFVKVIFIWNLPIYEKQKKKISHKILEKVEEKRETKKGQRITPALLSFFEKTSTAARYLHRQRYLRDSIYLAYLESVMITDSISPKNTKEKIESINRYSKYYIVKPFVYNYISSVEDMSESIEIKDKKIYKDSVITLTAEGAERLKRASTTPPLNMPTLIEGKIPALTIISSVDFSALASSFPKVLKELLYSPRHRSDLGIFFRYYSLAPDEFANFFELAELPLRLSSRDKESFNSLSPPLTAVLVSKKPVERFSSFIDILFQIKNAEDQKKIEPLSSIAKDFKYYLTLEPNKKYPLKILLERGKFTLLSLPSKNKSCLKKPCSKRNRNIPIYTLQVDLDVYRNYLIKLKIMSKPLESSTGNVIFGTLNSFRKIDPELNQLSITLFQLPIYRKKVWLIDNILYIKSAFLPAKKELLKDWKFPSPGPLLSPQPPLPPLQLPLTKFSKSDICFEKIKKSITTYQLLEAEYAGGSRIWRQLPSKLLQCARQNPHYRALLHEAKKTLISIYGN